MIENKKLSTYKVKKIILFFCIDIPASKTALLLNLNRNTINQWYMRFREVIYVHQTKLRERAIGGTADATTYFTTRKKYGFHQKIKTDRKVFKYPIFGIFEREGAIFTEIFPPFKHEELKEVIWEIKSPDKIINDKSWRGYNGLVDLKHSKHFRIKYDGKLKSVNNLNDMESFCSFSKRRLAKFNGVLDYLDLHLKECEWRWKKEPTSLIDDLWKLVK